MTVNDHLAKVMPRQNKKAIRRTRVHTCDLRENTHQIGIRFFSRATDDLFPAFHHDVGTPIRDDLGFQKLVAEPESATAYK
jgi:hypothetical protein